MSADSLLLADNELKTTVVNAASLSHSAGLDGLSMA